MSETDTRRTSPPDTSRVPVDLVLLMLRQSGVQTNARTIRNWRLRGHITRTADGYDLMEIVNYLDRRRDTPLKAA